MANDAATTGAPPELLQEMEQDETAQPAAVDPASAPMQGSTQQGITQPTQPTKPTAPAAPPTPAPQTPAQAADNKTASTHQKMMDLLGEMEAIQVPQKAAKEAAPPLPPPSEKKDFWQSLIEPVGANIYRGLVGFGGGVVNAADQVKAAAEGAGQAIGLQSGEVSQAAQANLSGLIPPKQNYPYQSLEKAYEQRLSPDVINSPAYKVGNVIGNAGAFALLPGDAEATLGRAALTGAGYGAAATNQQAMKETGHPPSAGQLALGTGAGAVLGAGGQAAIKGVGKLAGGIAKNLPKGMTKAETGAAQTVAMQGVPAANQPANALAKSEPINGKFRYQTTKKGHEHLEKGMALEEFAQHISKSAYEKLRKAMQDLSQALVFLRWQQKLRNHYAANALKLATKESQKELINPKTETSLASMGNKILAIKKSMLYGKQQAALKAKTEQDIQLIKAQMKGGGSKAKLERQLLELEQMHREQMLPKDVFDIPTGKHIRGQVDISHIEPENDLAKTFDRAFEQAANAQKLVNALQKQYDALKGEVQHLLEYAEEKMQTATGKKEPFWVIHKGAELKFQSGRVEMVPFGIGLRHDPWHAQLIGKYKKEYDAFAAVAHKYFEKQETTFNVKTGTAAPQTAKLLQSKGMLTEIGKRALGATLMGTLAYMDFEPAEAATSEEEAGKRTASTFIGHAAVGLALLALVGPKRGKEAIQIVKQIMKDPHFIFARFYAFTKDTLRAADNILVEKGLIEPTKSLAYRMDMIAARICDGMTFVPEKGHEFVDAIFHQGDTSGFSAIGQKLVGEIQESIKAMRKDVPDYVKHLEKLHRDNPESATLTNCLDAAQFVKHTFFPDIEGPMDTFFRNLGKNATRVWFTVNPRNMLAQVFDIAIAGPLQVGPKAMAQAYGFLIKDGELRKLVGEMYLTGSASQQVSEGAAKSTAFSTDRFNASVGTLASLLDYGHKHPDVIQGLGIKSPMEFAKQLLQGGIQDEGVRLEAFAKLINDVAALTGHDWFRINVPPALRSKFVRYGEGLVSQVARHASLLAKTPMEKNWTGLAASLFILQQVAGPAAIPKSVQALAWYASPDNFAKVQEFMRMYSAGEHIFGNLEGQVDYDPFIFLLMGVDRPGVETLREVIGDLPGTIAKLSDVYYNAINHPQRFVGDKGAEINEKAQKALKAVLNDFAYMAPVIKGIPIGRLPPLVYGLAEFIHKEFEVPPPKNILGEQKGSAQLKPYPAAQQDAARYMLGLPERMELANYQTAKYGLGRANLTGKQETQLNKMIERTGIPK
jgi:hypothetical protein